MEKKAYSRGKEKGIKAKGAPNLIITAVVELRVREVLERALKTQKREEENRGERKK